MSCLQCSAARVQTIVPYRVSIRRIAGATALVHLSRFNPTCALWTQPITAYPLPRGRSSKMSLPSAREGWTSAGTVRAALRERRMRRRLKARIPGQKAAMAAC